MSAGLRSRGPFHEPLPAATVSLPSVTVSLLVSTASQRYMPSASDALSTLIEIQGSLPVSTLTEPTCPFDGETSDPISACGL